MTGFIHNCLLHFVIIISRPDRLREIADRFNLDHSAMLDNVLYARAYTSMSIPGSVLLLLLYVCASGLF